MSFLIVITINHKSTAKVHPNVVEFEIILLDNTAIKCFINMKIVLSERKTINQANSPPNLFPQLEELKPFSAYPTCRIVDTKAFPLSQEFPS